MKLYFPIPDMHSVINHVRAATAWAEPPPEVTSMPLGPKLILVSEAGVYFTSNAAPADDFDPGPAPSCYALGINPKVDVFWSAKKRAAMGDHDHFEVLPWVDPIADLITNAPATHTVMIMDIDPKRLEMPTETAILPTP